MLDALRIALRAIVANRLRSLLTTLGLVIGVSSVIVLVAVGQGTQKGVTDQIRGLGTNLLFIEPSSSTSGGGAVAGGPGAASTLVSTDAETIASDISGVSAASALTTLDVSAVAGANDVEVELVVTSSSYAEVHDSELASGAFFTPAQEEAGSLVTVLGSRAADALFGAQDPVGQSVRISLAGGRITLEFVVIGVLQSSGVADAADQLFVPAEGLVDRLGPFLRSQSGGIRASQIDVQLVPGVDEESVKQQVSSLLTYLHEVTEPDFVIQSQDDLIGAASEVSNTLSILLGSIAGISLLVGGIGVMNIMLVSVTERTREIGIRRAVGATSRDVLMQFVAEAVTLSIFGGIVGIALGATISIVLNGREVGGQAMTTVIQPWSVVLAFLVAALVGFASGSYPAYRATSIDPIVALRNE
ncbi:MAG: ABC transporter permease [Dehalococcoidia bacterium]